MIKKPAKKSARPSAPKKKPAPKNKPGKPAASKKQSPAKGPQDEIGRVVAFFRIPIVAVVKLTKGTLKMGDRIWIKGHTTDIKQTIPSMQIDHQPITEAKKGNEAGIKVSARVRRGDRVYRITA